MAIKRAQAEQIIITRIRGWMEKINCTLYVMKATGRNETFDDPLAFALRQCGIVPADYVTPVDADFAGLADTLIDRMLDYAEFRALRTAWQNTVPEKRDTFDNVFTQLADAVRTKETFLKSAYGYGIAVEDTMPVIKVYEAAATDTATSEWEASA